MARSMIATFSIQDLYIGVFSHFKRLLFFEVVYESGEGGTRILERPLLRHMTQRMQKMRAACSTCNTTMTEVSLKSLKVIVSQNRNKALLCVV